MERGESGKVIFATSGTTSSCPVTTELKIVLPEDDVPRGTWPVSRMLVSEVSVLVVLSSFAIAFSCIIKSVASFSSCYCFVRMKVEAFAARTPPPASTRDASMINVLPEMYDLSQLRSSLISRHPHFAAEFESSELLRPSRNEYPDTRSTNTLLRAHRQMIRLRKMDAILHNAQRQGK